MVTILHQCCFTARLLLLCYSVLLCGYGRSEMCTMCPTRSTRCGLSWWVKNGKLLNLSEFAGLQCWFVDLQWATWWIEATSGLGSWHRSIQRSSRVTICNIARLGFWLAESMGPVKSNRNKIRLVEGKAVSSWCEWLCQGEVVSEEGGSCWMQHTLRVVLCQKGKSHTRKPCGIMSHI